MRALRAAAALGALLQGAAAAPAADEVTNLPGWPGQLPSKHYSGYLNFGPNNRKHIHYYYVEATGKDPQDPSTPVVLWLNGGPGCSSLDGWYYEMGPFRGSKEDPTKLVENPAAWNKMANMLYLEAPVGVGFSYSDDPSTDYKQDDDMSSQDNLHAVMAFFELFPELKKHKFFLTGESYAGIYVPTLAEAILWAVGNGTYTGAPLQGIAVGNGCTGSQIGICGGERDKYDTMYILGQAFLNRSMKNDIMKTCDLDNISPACHVLLQEMSTIVGHINLYNVYGECIGGEDSLVAKSGYYRAPLGQSKYFGAKVGGPDACIDSRAASAFFNQPSVMNATHVKPIQRTWATCGSAAGWSYNSNRPNLPRDTYPALIKSIRVIIYNGDWDACVPYTDNEAWTEGMGLPVVKPWHPWTYTSQDDGSTNQVGGYATVYTNGFTFVTIRGGRHEVPETAPVRGAAMVAHLLGDKEF
eukprot:TRINITY_DN9302_c0_g1_i1.p1 TRINITY_DN9302_c0_g1~~TRINITY_DN9302_c0_g1_i1.p1  ORF type:complete len:495 (+),score=208.67 TRINITY_DN9302_c0_g1_i1:81-1487(+)